MKKIMIICFTLVFAFTTIGSSFSYAYTVNDLLNNIQLQNTPDGILYTIGEEWELLETEQGTVVNKMPQNLEQSLKTKYLSNSKAEINNTSYEQKSFFNDILISFLTAPIATLMWNGVKWVAVSLVTGNPVPAAIVVLAITIAGIATMAVAAIYMVGTYQNPSADKVSSTSGCISRDGGRTWICPYRFAL